MRGAKTTIECSECKSSFIDYVSNKRSGFCSLGCYWKSRKANPKYPGYWLGKERTSKPAYVSVHMDLRRKYGPATRCENRDISFLPFLCSKKSNTYHWAFKEKKGHKRGLHNYMQLCASCHVKYDRS